MILGARTGAWAKAGGRLPTARDYVQDGLIAMWDGIENAGWGVHVSGVFTVWKNLIGSYDFEHYQGAKASFTKNSAFFDFDRNGYSAYRCNTIFGAPNVITMEACSSVEFRGNYSTMLSGIEAGGCGFQASNNKSTASVGKPSGGYYLTTSQFDIGAHTFSFSVFDRISFYQDATIKEIELEGSVNGIRWNLPYIGLSSDPGDEKKGGIQGHEYCLRIYNRALTAAEIATNYAVDKARFNLPDKAI